MAERRAEAQVEAWQHRLEVAREQPGWWRQAACRGATDTMFPANRGQIPAALAVCESCPVQLSCLADARSFELDALSRYVVGVRGGLTASQRVAVYRRIRRAPHNRPPECGTEAAYQYHRRRDEDCRVCREAHAARARAGPSPEPNQPWQCGDAFQLTRRVKEMLGL